VDEISITANGKARKFGPSAKDIVLPVLMKVIKKIELIQKNPTVIFDYHSLTFS
jgi:hypothetical protein